MQGESSMKERGMQYVLRGKKEEIERCKKALLLADEDFGVNIENLSVKREGLFQYELAFTIRGEKGQLKRFLQRLMSNYQILNGNILGLLNYYI